MIARDGFLAVHGGGDGNLQLLGEGDQLRVCAGGPHAAACDDDGPLRPPDHFQRMCDARWLGFGPEGGDLLEILLHDEFQIGDFLFHLP